VTHTDHKSKKKTGQTADGRVRQFFVAHKRWFSFIGAVVVFATFVSKEVLRDNLKDLVGALENAQTLFELRGDNASLRTQIFDLQVRILDIYDKIVTSKPRSDFARDVGQNLGGIYEVDEELRLVEPTLANTAELVGKLPPSDERAKALNRCREELKQAHDASAEAKSTVQNLSASRKFLPHPPPFTNDEQGQLASSVGKAANASRAVWQDVEESTLKIFEEARQYKEKKERQYKHWTLATYVLYTLGWTLGLLGSLYGVSGEGNPE
jgi:hypothetical protein